MNEDTRKAKCILRKLILWFGVIFFGFNGITLIIGSVLYGNLPSFILGFIILSAFALVYFMAYSFAFKKYK